jgi:hypothetical protein
MPDIAVHRYSPNDKKLWNDFVAVAKNSTFLFNRDYMDYHSARFHDHSLLIYSKGSLSAVFVANEEGTTVYSHAGLTYGGLVLKAGVRLEEVVRLFHSILRYYHGQSIESIVYKCFPSYCAKFPADEDQYVLFLLNAELIKRETSCVFSRQFPLPYRESRRKSVDDSKHRLYEIRLSNDPAPFWKTVLEPNLKERFGAKPVHSVEEIQLLMTRFPANIRVYEYHEKGLLAGAVIFEMENIAHAQYLSATPAGKEIGALDVLIDRLITEVYRDKAYFSFGTSNEDGGRILNRGLMNWKEGFGARTRVHDVYRIATGNYQLLASYE